MEGQLLEIDEWDRQEMWDNNIESCIYCVLRKQHPNGLTAEEIAAVLLQHGHQNAKKEDVGDAIYDGALKRYVCRTGEPPNRIWKLRVRRESVKV